MTTTPDMSCPAGGQFYACGDGSRFVGCCQSNPCGSTGCAAGNLKFASFDPASWGQIPDQQCNAGLFYTCSATDPPFWGCCQSNPCSSGSGCPADDLAVAFLSANPSDAQVFLGLNGTWEAAQGVSLTASTGATETAFSTSSSSFLIGSSTSSSSPSPAATAHSSSSNIAGPVAGGVVGGAAVIVALILGILFKRRRRAPSRTQSRVGKEPHQQSQNPAVVESNTPKIVPKPIGSPQPPYSPAPPSYHAEALEHPTYELPGAETAELDGGQRFHPYRPERAGPTPQSPG